jgi:tetratricopeptide (TPR) repeat protein
LNARAVVEGSVAISEGRVRIIAQLIDAPKDRHLWASIFDRDTRDILALQSEIAAAIAREIQLKLTPQEEERLASKRQVNPDAYQLYLQGREQINNTFDNQKALDIFRQATVIDPTFAEAYAGMALSYIQLGLTATVGAAPQEMFPRANAAANKAIELDDTIGLAYAALGDVKLWFDWDWKGAEEGYRHALDLVPQDTNIISCYSRYLLVMGRFDETIALSKRALELDPLSALLSIGLGQDYMYARRYDDGIAHLLKIRDIFSSESWSVNYHLAWNYAGKGMYQQAIELVDKSEKAWQIDPFTLTYFYAASGQRDKALVLLEKLLIRSRTEHIEPVQVAMVYCGLGDKEQAFQWLTKGYENRSPYMVALKTDPSLDPLRSDPRFIALLKKVGF